jgi:hydrogenase maturation protease
MDRSPRAAALVFAIGNASRGDDALGPTVGEALRTEGVFDGTAAELIEVYQLQIEDALELAGRDAVLFIDARRPRAGRPGAAGGRAVEIGPLEPALHPTPFTHALAPSALLEVAQRVAGGAPPAWLLAIEGEDFELGAPLSAAARARLAPALALARDWLRSGSGRRLAPEQSARPHPMEDGAREGPPPDTARAP